MWCYHFPSIFVQALKEILCRICRYKNSLVWITSSILSLFICIVWLLPYLTCRVLFSLETRSSPVGQSLGHVLVSSSACWPFLLIPSSSVLCSSGDHCLLESQSEVVFSRDADEGRAFQHQGPCCQSPATSGRGTWAATDRETGECKKRWT